MEQINAARVRERLTYQRLVDALAAGLQEAITCPPRTVHAVNASDTLLMMPAWQDGRYLGVKLVTVFPGNRANGQPAVSASYTLFDARDGTCLALIDGEELTLRRTAALAVLASRQLHGAPRQTVLTMLGAGVLARALIQAHTEVLGIGQVHVWNRDREHAAALAREMREAGIDCDAPVDRKQAMGHAGIYCCATTAMAPILFANDVAPGAHVNLMGAFRRSMREADSALIAQSRVFADSLVGVMTEGGDVLHAIDEGAIALDHVAGDLAQLLAGAVAGRTSPQQVTLLKSVGFAALDLIAARLVWEG